MSTLASTCSVCGTTFEPRFSYQVEEIVDRDAAGRPRARPVYFCSQGCSTEGRILGGSAACDACGAAFRVTLAAHVLTIGGARRYACGATCRSMLVARPTDARRARAEPDAGVPPVLDPDHAAPTSTVTRLRPRPASGARRPRVVAIFNHKGGTGKTTTAVTLAAGLAQRGRRVLIVDTDAQGNVAESFGLTAARSLYHVLVMGLDPREVVQSVRPGLDVLPSNETLAAAELYLAGRRHQRERLLATRLEAILPDYDFVLVDCSPSLSLMNQNALVLADAVICPVGCDYLSLVGVRQVLKTLKHVGSLLRHPVQLLGVLPTMFDPRANICREAHETLLEHFGDRCFDPIRQATRVKEAPTKRRTVLEHAPGSDVARDYLRVVDRLLTTDDQSAASALPA